MVKVIVVTILSIVAVLVVGYVFVMGNGKPIGTDISVIGQGRPAIVLAYENYSPIGGDALSLLRNVRGRFDSRLDFIVADLGTPQGSDFAKRYQLTDGVAVFLKPDGQALQVTRIPSQESELGLMLEAMLAAAQ